ncbi:uncharacterized protein N0V89_001695 [Didymosphaeria variabile]|uniref:Ketoreductase (KR) domain-containing protein n=1 Tax=Didymosphaeria variabile TaxID=1932322 RepID=A0A9W8XXJ8_9PLEO|nr:uncharacterized protein N0V89_001695 [Didymosphaeria variabile]KAJ4361126.1 hypothetical protein N0V89_001695 [Didymosphaeria variabile]
MIMSIAELQKTGADVDLDAAGSFDLDLRTRLATAIRRALEDLAYLSLESPVIPIDRISDVNVAVHSGNDGRARQIVLQWESALQAQVQIRPIDDRNMFSDSKTYWLAGLTGSLGLSLCEWMIAKGAKYIVMTSRKPNVSRAWQERMASLGAVVKVHSK